MPLVEYIYNLPFEVNKRLCRLLDNDNDWKILAGRHMSYYPCDIDEMEKVAIRECKSPTAVLLSRWGQLNHKVTELFVLLYRMEHVPALRTLTSCVPPKFHKLLLKLDMNPDINVGNMAVGANKLKPPCNGNDTPVKATPKDSCHNLKPVQVCEKVGRLVHSDHSTRALASHKRVPDDSKGSLNSNGVSKDPISKVAEIRKVSYEELAAATGNWDPKNLLGRGGFGEVYKGEWKRMTVAVKILKDHPARNANDQKPARDLAQELVQEMCLNQYRHDNIVPLYCYSIGGPATCIVYKYMSGGTLEHRLRRRNSQPPLTWAQRHNIALGVANGLQFLHTVSSTPLIHGDIKPANILLDQCAMPQIGDFGLARKGVDRQDATHLVVTSVRGTLQYLPYEYISSNCLSTAVDVFSFGVVLVEMATAFPCQDKRRKGARQFLSIYIHERAAEELQMGNSLGVLEDEILRNTPASNPKLCHDFVSLGLLCTNKDRHQRPSMLQVHDTIKNMVTPVEFY